MKKNGLVLLFILIAVLVFGSVAAAQDDKREEVPDGLVPTGTISDGTATFEYTGSITFSSAPTSNLRITGVNSNGDHIWTTWWWYRVDGDAEESVLPVEPDSETFVGDTATLTWSDVDGRGLFSAELVVTIEETGVGSGAILQQDLTITNLSTAQDLDIDIFAFADIDLAGTISNDSATLNTANHIIDLVDGGTTAQFASNFVSQGAYQVESCCGLYTILNDGNVDNLANTSLPFGPGDFTGGFQDGTRTIPASSQRAGTQKYTATIAINGTAPTAVGLNDVVAATSGNVAVVGLLVLMLGLATAVVLKRKQQIA